MKGKIIKQPDGSIAVEYKQWNAEGDEFSIDAKIVTLPLHPDDWEVAIAFIGHEMEFEQTLYPHVEAEEGLWAADPRKPIAKLLLPTPVRTIEDIPEELRKNYTPCPRCGKGFLTYSEEKDDVFCSNCPYPEYPVEETWDDIHKEYLSYRLHFEGDKEEILLPWNWLKQHYYIPKRK